MKTLAYRAKTVVSEREARRKELEHLIGALKCNRYPDWILRELKENNSDEGEVKRPEPVKETSDKERNKKIPVVIPFIKGFSEQIRWVLGKYGIQHTASRRTHCANCWLKVLYGFQSICKQKCKHLVRCKWYNWMYLLTFGQCHP